MKREMIKVKVLMWQHFHGIQTFDCNDRSEYGMGARWKALTTGAQNDPSLGSVQHAAAYFMGEQQ